MKERRSPRRPRPAWVEARAPQGKRSPDEQHEERTMELMMNEAGRLAVYKREEESVYFILLFVSSTQQDEDLKMQFLRSISNLCRTAKDRGLWRGLSVFCNKYELAEHIKVLLEEEPLEHLRTEVRQQAMLALGNLSYVKSVLDGKKNSIMYVCFNSVFLLPSQEDMKGPNLMRYFKTLDAMDHMLKLFIKNSPITGFWELQNILQILLPFANSHSEAICERAVGRITKLTSWLAASFSPQIHSISGGHKDRYTECNMPVLGQLVGRLLLCHTCKNWQLRWEALDALHYLFRFIQKNRSTAPEDTQEPQEEAEAVFWLPSPTTTDIAMNFGQYLRPSQRTDVILMVIEALRDSSIYDKQEASSVLDMAIQDSASWLTDVPKIMRCIYGSVECISTASARQSLDILILWLTNQWPKKVVRSLLKISPSSDSAALAMWEAMFSQNQTMEKVLREILDVLQDQQLRRLSGFVTDDNCIRHLALLAHADVGQDDLDAMYHLQRLLKRPSLVMHSLALRVLLPVSERPVMARQIPVLLPGIMEGLQAAKADTKMKALLLIGNVMGHVKRKQASSIALQVAGEILPLFNDECSQVQELSICLYNKVMQVVLWCHKRQMKKIVRRGLLPLFFHLSDQTQSVAKASVEALVTAAAFLKREELKRLAQTEQTWRIAECLLVQDKRMVEEYLQQSLPYLQHTQVTLREAAVRFIGLAAQHCKDQSERKIHEICSVLQPLQNDEELSVVSLTTQTIFILRCPRMQPTSRWCLWALCCWPS
ncbi:uncharacterized protein LOC121062495 [Cygnus olor]|uniref:uncharacterized protein LOC121062495 n=1 Tax=Cygnus olor TaxID=8869 RepID=UPI001ADE20DB|nr:uncharacterized protein LOC121062495 [Cygnus olor]